MRDVLAFTLLGTLLVVQYHLMWAQDGKKGYEHCNFVAVVQTFSLFLVYCILIDWLIGAKEWPWLRSTSWLFITNLWTYRWVGLAALRRNNRIFDRYLFYRLVVYASVIGIARILSS